MPVIGRVGVQPPRRMIRIPGSTQCSRCHLLRASTSSLPQFRAATREYGPSRPRTPATITCRISPMTTAYLGTPPSSTSMGPSQLSPLSGPRSGRRGRCYPSCTHACGRFGTHQSTLLLQASDPAAIAVRSWMSLKKKPNLLPARLLQALVPDQPPKSVAGTWQTRPQRESTTASSVAPLFLRRIVEPGRLQLSAFRVICLACTIRQRSGSLFFKSSPPYFPPLHCQKCQSVVEVPWEAVSRSY